MILGIEAVGVVVAAPGSHFEAGRMSVRIGRTFSIDDIVEAHHVMETNRAGGKIVVLT